MPANSNWQDKPSVKKGNVGEAIVDRYLVSNGFIPYRPIADKAHPFDRLCASPDKRTIFVVDAKAKPARKYYPDTGINVRHYNDYLAISQRYRLHVFLAFVDEDSESIYGQFLHVLDRPRTVSHKGKMLTYPMVKYRVRFWPLCSMRKIADLGKEDVATLRSLSQRNPAYAND